MSSIEFSREMLRFIRHFSSPEQALQEVESTPAPYRYREAKKALKKLIRTYIFEMRGNS